MSSIILQSAPMCEGSSFKDGNLGIMDYYKMENIKSDTGMRDAIADTDIENTSDNPVED